MALDRQGIIDTIYKGAALLPRALSNPGTWGYGQRRVPEQPGTRCPDLTHDSTRRKQLVQEAGATGKTIVLGMSSERTHRGRGRARYQAAAEASG